MHVQVISISAVRSVLRQEKTFMAGQRLHYVMSRCPDRGASYLFGTGPWNLAHATRSFREKHGRR